MSDFGTVAVAVVTVIVGTYMKDFAAEDFRRFRDAQAMAGALAGELRSHHSALDMLRAALAGDLLKLAHTNKALPLYEIEKPVSAIYEASILRLGLLGPDLAGHLAATYEQINGFRAGFYLLCKHHATMEESESVARIMGCLAALARAEKAGQGLIDALDARANARYRDRLLMWISSTWARATNRDDFARYID